MIVIWYQDRGQRPNKTKIIREDANKASLLPSSFEVVGVQFGRRVDEQTVDNSQFALRVNTSSDNISQDAVNLIATAFESNWGGTVEHVETIQ